MGVLSNGCCRFVVGVVDAAALKLLLKFFAKNIMKDNLGIKFVKDIRACTLKTANYVFSKMGAIYTYYIDDVVVLCICSYSNFLSDVENCSVLLNCC
jgi:hypothetical protein